ncbi:MAG: class I SAM-dependent methyltransferase [Proteobacteria bacterium]|nr:class I SAM-dependent methyltransferase [Pseudomonadota bacterium]MBU1688929.1 class I SAM-dependent methyltransferase [Pseudomonadota bacterium]
MWNQRYSDPEFVYGTSPNEFLRRNASRIPMGKVLCLAEGEGRNAVYLAEQGYMVTAVDSSEVGLAKANQLADERGVTVDTEVEDLARYEITPGTWDGIVSIFCHLSPSVRVELHKKVVDGLRPGGVLLLEAYTPAQLAQGTGGPPSAELMMTLSALKDELAGLAFEVGREIKREVLEGKLHTGMGVVVQIIAVKMAGR